MLLENDDLFLLDDDLLVLFGLFSLSFLDERYFGSPVLLFLDIGIELIEFVAVQLACRPLVLYSEVAQYTKHFL